MKPENALMHAKIKRRLLETVLPLLSEAVEEGIAQGVFACDNIPETGARRSASSTSSSA